MLRITRLGRLGTAVVQQVRVLPTQPIPSQTGTNPANVSARIPPEVAEIPRMGGVSVRKTLVAAVTRGNEEDARLICKKAAWRLFGIAKDVKYWDAVTILRCFATARVTDEKKCFHALAQSIENQLSLMAPKHIIDCISAYEALNVRPKTLYTALFLALEKHTPTMYSDEMSGMMLMLARHGIKHEGLLDKLAGAICANVENIKFPHACEIAGSFAHLGFSTASFYQTLETQVRSEVLLMRANEHFAEIRRLAYLEASWKPFESILEKEGFVPFVNSLQDETQIEQVTRPMELFAFLRYREFLTEGVLAAFCKWATVAAKRPKTRFSKRICLDDLAVIADVCMEKNIAVASIQEAIKEFEKVESGVTDPTPPVMYARRRRYIRKRDYYVKARLAPVAGHREKPRNYKQSPNQWLAGKRANAAWFNFPLPWYYNR